MKPFKSLIALPLSLGLFAGTASLHAAQTASDSTKVVNSATSQAPPNVSPAEMPGLDYAAIAAKRTQGT
jgi:hypothetical protein